MLTSILFTFLEVYLLCKPIAACLPRWIMKLTEEKRQGSFCKVNKHWDTDKKKESVNEEASYGKFVRTENSKSEGKYGKQDTGAPEPIPDRSRRRVVMFDDNQGERHYGDK